MDRRRGNGPSVLGSGLLAVGDSFKELAAIFFIVLIPTVPLTFFGWTLLALKQGAGQTVKAVRAAEGWLARRADAHLCVSQALRDELRRWQGIDAL